MNQNGHSPHSSSPSPCQSNEGTVFPANAEIPCFPAIQRRTASNQSQASLSENAAIQRRKLAGGEGHHHSAPSHSPPLPLESAHRQHSEPNLNPQARIAQRPQNLIAVPPDGHRIGQIGKEGAEGATTDESGAAAKRHSSQTESHKSGREEGMLVQLQQKLFEHYHTAAYALVIVSYFLAFCEYLYLRLISLIFPDSIIYHRQCEKHFNEIVYRNELHFASGVAVFLVMSTFQLACFFLLTVSSKYLEVKRTFSHVLSIEERLQHELVFAVKRTMFATLYPTFAIYILCSSVIFCSIFYMVGLRDPIVHVGSQVIVHLFDLFVILYFLAFPVLCVLFHPDIDCRAKLFKFCCTKQRRRKGQNSGSQSFSQRKNAKAEADAGTGGEGRTFTAPCRHQMPTRICPATADAPINYGSLERRGGGECAKEEGAMKEGEEIGGERRQGAEGEADDSIRRRMRQRRQSRYKRLRGSDESAECQNEGGMEEKIRRNEQMEEEEMGEEEEEMGTEFRGLELAKMEEGEDGFGGPVKC